MRVPGKDESPYAHIDIALQFCVDLIRITYQCAGAARAGPSNSRPYVFLYVVIRRLGP